MRACQFRHIHNLYLNYNGSTPISELYGSELEKTIFLNLFSIYTIKLLGKIYLGRDFDLCSEGVMKCPGG